MKRFIVLTMVLILSLGWSMPILADELKDAEQEKNSIDSRLNQISKDKGKINQEARALETEKSSLEKKQAEENQQYEQIVDELKQLEEDIVLISKVVEEAEENYGKQKEIVKTRLRVMYEVSNIDFFQTLMQSKSINDFFGRLELIALISRNDKELIESLKAAKLDVEYKKQLKEEKKEEVTTQALEKERELSQLKASREELDARLKSKKAELSKLERQEDELLKKSNELINIIKNLQSKKKYTGGEMIWPAPSCTSVTSEYGMRRHPILKKNKMHTGIDIGAKSGASIVAANDGVVILAKFQSGYGNTVIIDHGGGIATLYAHCSKILVKEGTEVKAGDNIAKVGSTGLSTGPHLHFEVREDGVTKDPLEYVSS